MSIYYVNHVRIQAFKINPSLLSTKLPSRIFCGKDGILELLETICCLAIFLFQVSDDIDNCHYYTKEDFILDGRYKIKLLRMPTFTHDGSSVPVNSFKRGIM